VCASSFTSFRLFIGCLWAGMSLLKKKNDVLQAQVRALRGELTASQKQVEELQSQEGRWRETVLCINRLWDELNSSIAFLRYR
jgi:hypothetical protein